MLQTNNDDFLYITHSVIVGLLARVTSSEVQVDFISREQFKLCPVVNPISGPVFKSLAHAGIVGACAGFASADLT
jgi:hypothetical protein